MEDQQHSPRNKTTERVNGKTKFGNTWRHVTPHTDIVRRVQQRKLELKKPETFTDTQTGQKIKNDCKNCASVASKTRQQKKKQYVLSKYRSNT